MFSQLDNLPHTTYICPTCFLECQSHRELTQHCNSAHRQFTPESDGRDNRPISTYEYHPHLTGMYKHYLSYLRVLTIYAANPCNETGEYLPLYTRSPACPNTLDGSFAESWSPFISCIEFEFAHFHFVEAQSSAGLIDKALDLWAATVVECGEAAP